MGCHCQKKTQSAKYVKKGFKLLSERFQPASRHTLNAILMAVLPEFVPTKIIKDGVAVVTITSSGSTLGWPALNIDVTSCKETALFKLFLKK